jgi:hypothetical protein
MAQHGGYRKPTNPAAASGPGALSKRTDGGPQPRMDLPDAGYGEQATFQADQGGAPMAGAGARPTAAGGGGGQPHPVTPFGAPSARPDEPVTMGADAGEGFGLAGLGLQDPDERLKQADLENLRSALPYLSWVASQPGSSASLQDYVRRVRSALQ